MIVCVEAEAPQGRRGVWVSTGSPIATWEIPCDFNWFWLIHAIWKHSLLQEASPTLCLRQILAAPLSCRFSSKCEDVWVKLCIRFQGFGLLEAWLYSCISPRVSAHACTHTFTHTHTLSHTCKRSHKNNHMHTHTSTREHAPTYLHVHRQALTHRHSSW